MIPKIIHYCWFGGNPLPPDARRCIASWKKHCPDYEIRPWNETNFDISAHPFMRAAWDAKAWAFVSDYARLQVVYTHGGIYLDTDVELKQSLDGLLAHSCYVGLQQVGPLVATGLGFGAQQGHPAVKAMLDIYDTVTFDPANREALACPILNTQALLPFGVCREQRLQQLPALTVYPSKFFDPVSPGDHEILSCPETVSIHHYSASWMSFKARLRRQIIIFLGQERMAKLRGVLKK